jgi:vacuolar-type H+-ATPase subunit I/STV1
MFTSQIASFQPQASASSPGAPLDMDAETIKYLSQALERLIIDRRIEGNEYLRELRDEVVRVHREGGGVEEDEEETVVAFSVRNQGEGKVVL